MSQTAIGTAALILTTNSAQARAGLEKFGAEAKRGAEKAAKNVESSFSPTKLFAKLELVSMVFEPIKNFIKDTLSSMADWASGVAKAREELAATQTRLKAVEESTQRAAKHAAEWRAALTDRGDVAGSFGAELAQLERTRAELVRLRAQADKDWDQAADRGSFSNFGRFLVGRDTENVNIAKKKFEEIGQSIDKVTQRMEELGEARKRALDAKSDPAVIADFNKALEDQFDRVAQAGMTAAQKIAFRFQKIGLPDHMVSTLERAAALAEAAEKSASRASTAPAFRAPVFKGSAADVSARLRHEFGGSDPAKQLLDLQKKANKELEAIKNEARKLNAKPGATIKEF